MTCCRPGLWMGTLPLGLYLSIQTDAAEPGACDSFMLLGAQLFSPVRAEPPFYAQAVGEKWGHRQESGYLGHCQLQALNSQGACLQGACGCFHTSGGCCPCPNIGPKTTVKDKNKTKKQKTFHPYVASVQVRNITSSRLLTSLVRGKKNHCRAGV